MRLPVPMFTTVTALAVVLGGCASSAEGVPVADPSHIVRSVSGGELNTILLTPKQLSEIVGATVRLRSEAGRPITGSPGPCSALEQVGMRGFVGDAFLAFHLFLLADHDGPDREHVVAEAATIYPDSGAATAAFSNAAAELAECDGKAIKQAALWRFAVNDISADTVLWNKEQIDLPFLWVCHGQSRVRVNVIMQAMVCQGNDDGRAHAEVILDRMSATVWELAGG